MMTSNESERLPARRTFTLRFAANADPEIGVYRGRIEHLATGRTARFKCMDDVIRFVTEIFAEVQSDQDPVS